MKRFFRRLRFWLFQRGKQCKSCCVFCRFYDICKLDFKPAKSFFERRNKASSGN